MKKVLKKVILSIVVIILFFSCFAYIGVSIAHYKVFSRVDYKEYDTNKYITYEDIDYKKYEREVLQIPSGENTLTGYLYGRENTKGLIIISPGHRDPSDVKLYEITYFVDHDWMVLCYDYTGCFNSGGKSMIDYNQAPKDLDAVLSYVEDEDRFTDMKLLLFGHSLGGYATAAVLQDNHNITAAIVASGFDTPMEQWIYSVGRFTGVFREFFKPFSKAYMKMNYGADSYLSAIDGINSVDIPVLVISGTDDEFYGGESRIYEKKDEITNKNCTFMLMDKKNHNGHYDYFLTDEAVEYQKKVDNGQVEDVDKELYMEHNENFMDKLNDFYENVIEQDKE